MAIDGISQQISQNLSTNQGAVVNVGITEPSAQQAENNDPSYTDTVSVTDTANLLNSLEQIISSLPVVDSERVLSIQQALDEGSYNPDYNRTAEKMIEQELALGLT